MDKPVAVVEASSDERPADKSLAEADVTELVWVLLVSSEERSADRSLLETGMAELVAALETGSEERPADESLPKTSSLGALPRWVSAIVDGRTMTTDPLGRCRIMTPLSESVSTVSMCAVVFVVVLYRCCWHMLLQHRPMFVLDPIYCH